MWLSRSIFIGHQSRTARRRLQRRAWRNVTIGSPARLVNAVKKLGACRRASSGAIALIIVLLHARVEITSYGHDIHLRVASSALWREVLLRGSNIITWRPARGDVAVADAL